MGKLNRSLNICIDIDGTMTEPYYFMPYFNKYFGRDLRDEDCTQVRLDKLYEVSREEMMAFYEKEGERMHKNAPMLPMVRDVFEELGQSHRLYIVTARLKEMEYVTLEWLEHHQMPGVEVHSLGSHYKVERAKDLHCDIFIEDNPFISMELAESGIQVLLMDTNYNKETEHPNITRVQNWEDIRRYIKNME